MEDKKRIIDARADSKGNITHVKFNGNSSFTPVDRAIPMAEQNKIENAHVVHRSNGSKHLRTNPDKSKGNNLDEMAKD